MVDYGEATLFNIHNVLVELTLDFEVAHIPVLDGLNVSRVQQILQDRFSTLFITSIYHTLTLLPHPSPPLYHTLTHSHISSS